jgi:hypothetical protein
MFEFVYCVVILQECICSEKQSRSFLDGKRSALRYSKFNQSRSLELQQPDKTHLAFLNTLEYCMEKNLQKARGDYVTDPKPWRHPDFSQYTETRIHKHEEHIQNRLNDILLNSHNTVSSAEAVARQSKDPDIAAWTETTVKMSASYKNGAQMSFPVLVHNPGHGGGTNIVHSRTKRWGTGQMALIGATSDDDPIKGPPSNLEVFKRASHHKKRVSLADQIKSTNFSKDIKR